MSKQITVTITHAGHQYGATLTLTTAPTGSVVIFRDGERVAKTNWNEEGFAPHADLGFISGRHGDTDDSADALDKLRRAMSAKLEQDETHMSARRAMFAGA